MLDSRPGASMKDEDYRRWVRVNLPHARTIAQRVGRSLEALDAFGGAGNGDAPPTAAAFDALERRLRGVRRGPPARGGAELGLRCGERPDSPLR